jgi:lipopolysaccharide export system ATP-binding protein
MTLKVEGLRKRFGKKLAVREVSFSMESGEIVGLLGPNGAGKTTVFYMIAGFLRPNAGKILLDEKAITRFPMYKRARAGIAYLPQEPSVFRKLSVEDNIRAILETRRKLNGKARKERLAADPGVVVGEDKVLGGRLPAGARLGGARRAGRRHFCRAKNPK